MWFGYRSKQPILRLCLAWCNRGIQYRHRKNSIQIRANGITVEFCRREEVRQLNGMIVGRTRMCPALKPLLIELRNSYAHGAR